MQARFYVADIGRFYSNDPIGALSHIGTSNGIHGFNRYAYGNNNPYKYIDSDGKESRIAQQEDINVKEVGKGEITKDEFANRQSDRIEAADAASLVTGTGTSIKGAKALAKADNIKQSVENVSTVVEDDGQIVALVIGMAEPPRDVSAPERIDSGRGNQR